MIKKIIKNLQKKSYFFPNLYYFNSSPIDKYSSNIFINTFPHQTLQYNEETLKIKKINNIDEFLTFDLHKLSKEDQKIISFYFKKLYNLLKNEQKLALNKSNIKNFSKNLNINIFLFENEALITAYEIIKKIEDLKYYEFGGDLKKFIENKIISYIKNDNFSLIEKISLFEISIKMGQSTAKLYDKITKEIINLNNDIIIHDFYLLLLLKNIFHDKKYLIIRKKNQEFFFKLFTLIENNLTHNNLDIIILYLNYIFQLKLHKENYSEYFEQFLTKIIIKIELLHKNYSNILQLLNIIYIFAKAPKYLNWNFLFDVQKTIIEEIINSNPNINLHHIIDFLIDSNIKGDKFILLMSIVKQKIKKEYISIIYIKKSLIFFEEDENLIKTIYEKLLSINFELVDFENILECTPILIENMISFEVLLKKIIGFAEMNIFRISFKSQIILFELITKNSSKNLDFKSKILKIIVKNIENSLNFNKLYLLIENSEILFCDEFIYLSNSTIHIILNKWKEFTIEEKARILIKIHKYENLNDLWVNFLKQIESEHKSIDLCKIILKNNDISFNLIHKYVNILSENNESLPNDIIYLIIKNIIDIKFDYNRKNKIDNIKEILKKISIISDFNTFELKNEYLILLYKFCIKLNLEFDFLLNYCLNKINNEKNDLENYILSEILLYDKNINLDYRQKIIGMIINKIDYIQNYMFEENINIPVEQLNYFIRILTNYNYIYNLKNEKLIDLIKFNVKKKF